MKFEWMLFSSASSTHSKIDETTTVYIYGGV